MTSNIPNYMAVKDLINCGVHEGRTGEAWGGGGEAQSEDVAEKRGKKDTRATPKKEKENKRVMRKKVVGSVCYGGSGALVFTA